MMNGRQILRALIPAVVYAGTALAFARYVDALYGEHPALPHATLVYAVTAGALLYAIASLLSLFALRFAASCGLVASLLSWPLFWLLAGEVPWRQVRDILCCSDWAELLTAFAALVASTICSFIQLLLSNRAAAALPRRDAAHRGLRRDR